MVSLVVSLMASLMVSLVVSPLVPLMASLMVSLLVPLMVPLMVPVSGMSVTVLAALALRHVSLLVDRAVVVVVMVVVFAVFGPTPVAIAVLLFGR